MAVAHAVTVADQKTAAQADHNNHQLTQAQALAVHHPAEKHGKTDRAVGQDSRHRRTVQRHRQRPQAVEHCQQQTIAGIKGDLRAL
ncbi:hypothetical protein D3C78_1308650 [compost metagenome]